MLKRNKNNNTLTVPFEKSTTISFASSITKNIVEPSALYRFPVKLIWWVGFRSDSRFGCLLKSIPINL